jgi:hypothetical protein
LLEEVIHRASPGEAEKLRFIGHSLGGAMAVCAAYEFQNWDGGVEIITFGAPRVGNAASVTSLDRAQ